MTSNAKNVTRIILCSSPAARDQLLAAPELRGMPCEWFAGVFETVAILAAEIQDIPRLVCVQVDHLDEQEMRVFVTLRKLDRVNVFAFSALTDEDQPKLNQALAAGADGAANLVDLPAKLAAWLQMPASPEPEDGSDEETASPFDASHPRGVSFASEEQPLLTEEELQALLGYPEAAL